VSKPKRNITCSKCRFRHPPDVTCEAAKRKADFAKLRELIAEYAEAYYADGVKGGGDPQSFAEIEISFKLQTERLNDHIDKMEREQRE
jgi:hypothetical protein